MPTVLLFGSLMLASQPLSPSRTPWALLAWIFRAALAAHPGRTVDAAARAALLFCHLLARRRQLRRWLRPGDSALREMLALRPSLVSVVRRPYISTGWAPGRRLLAVEEHYHHPSSQARTLWLAPDASLRLARVDSRGSSVEVVLDSPHWFIHEGELSLSLFQGGERIYSLAFSLGLDRGEPVAYVGALQGLRSDGALARYRQLTQALHGLRPKDLLISAFRRLCHEIGLTRWRAVSDPHRVSCSAYFKATERPQSSYDTAWRDHGGTLRPDGFYDMPVRVARRSHAETPPHKRNRYRQRYEMLDRLDADMAESLRERMLSLDASSVPSRRIAVGGTRAASPAGAFP